MKVFLLGGAGRVGQEAARILAASDLVSKIAIAGRNLERAEQAAAELGDKASAVRVDATNEEQLALLAANYDILVNVAGPDFEVPLPAIRAAIRARTDYCDIGADGPMTEQVLELDANANAAGIRAIIGIGHLPGVTNLMAMHAANQFSEVEAVQIVGVAPQARIEPEEAAAVRRSGRVSATQQTELKWFCGRVRVYRDGGLVDIDPFENIVDVALPAGRVVTAYPIASTEPITLPRYAPQLKSVSVLLSWFPPQVNDLYREQVRRIAAGEVSLPEAALSFMEAVAGDPERWLAVPSGLSPLPQLPAAWAFATGQKEGRPGRYACRLTVAGGITVAALTTAVLKILGGEIDERGVLAPEACFDPLSFFADVAHSVSEPRADGKLMDESFEFLG